MPLKGCRLIASLLVLFTGVGCVSVFNEKPPVSGVDIARERFRKSPVYVTYSETFIHGEDGVQGADVHNLMRQVGDMVNRAFLERLRRKGVGLELFDLRVPPEEGFALPMTLPASPLLSGGGTRVAMWVDEDATAMYGGWRLGARHDAAFHVFNDTVELQLVSVVTVVDQVGHAVWQASARSRKQFDNWASGEHLAALTARFVMNAAGRNADAILGHAVSTR